MVDIEEESDSDDDSYEGEIKSDGLKFSAASDVEGYSDVEAVPESKFKEDPKKHTADDASQLISNNKGVNDVEESIFSGHFRKSEVPRTGGLIIQLMDDLELCVSNKVNFLSLQETKMEKIEFFNIKRCWGNFSFEYVYSEAVDYFTMVRGMWVPNEKMLLIISVYAPQELSEKRMLWDYLSLVISNWEGEVVIIGDFNKVRDKRERFGSVFNRQGADNFNSFISSVSLVEVPLGGCSFTWCHKSATKTSKLDRFLISDNLMCLCPNISSSTLDRYLSDHRTILMREV
nr:RNA-directed DNA polymerase, eukaryota [Tanacetum cinerariifolium]